MIDPIHLLSCARDLIGDGPGCNPEYERALVELISDALGIPADARHIVVRILGLSA